MWSQYGDKTTEAGSELDACPQQDGAGPYHCDPAGQTLIKDYVAGCALGVADVATLDEVTIDNVVIFSTQPECVWKRETTFDIPDKMPPCTNDVCICVWYWLARTGQANFYMTGFYCKFTQTTSTVRWDTPKTPVGCLEDESKCVSGAKTPIYVYNNPTNVDWGGNNDNRPRYAAAWSFAIEGAQTDLWARGGSGNDTTPETNEGGTTSKGNTQQSTTAHSTSSSSSNGGGEDDATRAAPSAATTSQPSAGNADEIETPASATDTAAAATSSDSDGVVLSTGAIVGLAIVGTLALCCILFLIYRQYGRRSRSSSKQTDQGGRGSDGDSEKALVHSTSGDSSEDSSDSSSNDGDSSRGRHSMRKHSDSSDTV